MWLGLRQKRDGLRTARWLTSESPLGVGAPWVLSVHGIIHVSSWFIFAFVRQPGQEEHIYMRPINIAAEKMMRDEREEELPASEKGGR